MIGSALRAAVLFAAIFALMPAYAQRVLPASDEALWAAVADGGHVVLMRHALAPGVGDPPGFLLTECVTQRNLSDEGRQQAKAIGARLRARGVREVRVYSSRWCRALETARLLRLGEVRPLPALDSFFENPAEGEARSARVRALIRESADGATLVLVTHQVNITALTGRVPDSGEMLVLRADGDRLRVLGTLR